MANTHFVANLQTGAGTLTLKVFTRGTNTLINTGGDTAAEDGTRAGFYDWTVTENVTGIQDAVITNAGGSILAWLQTPIEAADDTGVYVLEEVNNHRLSSGTGTGQITLTSGVASANAVQLSGDSTAADNAESFFDGTGYAGTNNVIPLVTLVTTTTTATTATNVTTVNGLAAGVITATSIAADAITADKISTGAIDADALAADAGTEIGAAVLSALGTGTWASAIPWNAAWDAEVQSEVSDEFTSRGITSARAGYLDNVNNSNLALVPAFPSNFAALGINASGHISRVTLTDTATTVTNQLTAAQAATAVWQDTTAGDFTVSGSIGKSLFTSGAVPGATGGLFIAGSNATTTVNITGNITGNLVGTVSTLTTYTGNTPQTGDAYAYVGTNVGALGANLSAVPKTGYKLASDGLDSVATTAPTGVASNFREMLVQTWRRLFKRSTLNNITGELKTYADNGTTVITTQTCTDDGTTQTQGVSS